MELIARGEFREDLYYRISVVTLALPPLRDRKQDIMLLAEYFIRMCAQQYGKSIVSVSAEVAAIMQHHQWPGNIRELRNCIERAVIFCEGSEVGLQDLPRQYQCVETRNPKSAYAQAQEDLDRKTILDALRMNEGIKQKAADSLQMHRKTLYNKMKKLGLS
jgi:DNA-binding NtrC family response regulator